MSKSLPLAPLGLGIEGGRQNEVRMGLPRRVHGMATDICGTQSSPGVERDDKTSSASSGPVVRRLADEFAVTTSAMRVRLQQMKVVRA